MPRGYTFLPKGIPYKTLHTRKLTHAANQPLYIVASKNKTTLGLRAPTHIIKKVHIRAKATLTSRRLATTHRDAAALSKARACLTRLFAKMPEGKKEHVLRHGFKKESGRVGRLGAWGWRRGLGRRLGRMLGIGLRGMMGC